MQNKIHKNFDKNFSFIKVKGRTKYFCVELFPDYGTTL